MPVCSRGFGRRQGLQRLAIEDAPEAPVYDDLSWQDLKREASKAGINTHGKKRPVLMKFPWFYGSSIPVNGFDGRIYSVSRETDRNLPHLATVYGHRFIASDS